MRPGAHALTSPVRPARGEPLAELARLRQEVHGLLGSLFCYPVRNDLAGLMARSAGFARRDALARELPFYPRLRVLLDRLAHLSDREAGQLEQEFVDLFVVSASQPPCPPYESAYVEQRGGERGLVSAEVERAYAAAGIALAEHGELPDHAALELGFLSLLCAEEERGWRHGDVERALERLERQEKFHERHLGRWFPSFARHLGRVTAPGSLYRTLADAAHAFAVHDRDLVRALAELASARLEGSRL